MKVVESSGWRGVPGWRIVARTLGIAAIAAIALGNAGLASAGTVSDRDDRQDRLTDARHASDPQDPQAAMQVYLYVDPAAGNDSAGDGSLERPFQTISHALEAAVPQTIVRLAPGTYSAATGEQFPIALRSGVTLLGDPDRFGAGVEIVGGGWLMTPTAGEQNAAILGFDGAGLSGVTVRNPDGSAIWVTSGTPWLVSNTIAENARHGIAAHSGTPYILNNRFGGNGGADIELSDRATPQLQGNQFEAGSDRAIAYFAVDSGSVSVASGLVESGGVPIAAASREPNIRRSAREAATVDETAEEVVPWQGASSFPPLVRPSAARAPASAPVAALPIDPDLETTSRAARAQTSQPRPTLTASPDAVETVAARPASSRDRPAVIVRPRVTPETDTGAIAATTPDANSDIVSWGAQIDDRETTSGSRSESRAESRPGSQPESLLRWEGLTASRPATPAPELPPPVVAPRAASAPETTIAARPAAIEPLARTSLPLAYEPSNTEPAWPQPIARAISGPIPLPVPDPYPPLGDGGPLPPPPATTSLGTPLPPGLAYVPIAPQARYRLLVEAEADIAAVRALVGEAIATELDGQEVIQVGVFRDRWRAEQLRAALQDAGWRTWIADVQ